MVIVDRHIKYYTHPLTPNIRVWIIPLDENYHYETGPCDSCYVTDVEIRTVGDVALDHKLLYKMGFKDPPEDSNISVGGQFIIWFSKHYGEKAWGDNVLVDVAHIRKIKAPQ